MYILPLFTKLSLVFQRGCLDFPASNYKRHSCYLGQTSDSLITYTAFRAKLAETGTYQRQSVTVTETGEYNNTELNPTPNGSKTRTNAVGSKGD